MNSVIIYDSTCLLCSKSVAFVLKHDIEKHFYITSFSGKYASKLHLPNETVVLITPEDKILMQENAIAYILRRLPKVKWLLVVFRITPKSLQNGVYRFVAKNRKYFFGSTSCVLANTYPNRFIP